MPPFRENSKWGKSRLRAYTQPYLHPRSYTGCLSNTTGSSCQLTACLAPEGGDCPILMRAQALEEALACVNDKVCHWRGVGNRAHKCVQRGIIINIIHTDATLYRDRYSWRSLGDGLRTGRIMWRKRWGCRHNGNIKAQSRVMFYRFGGKQTVQHSATRDGCNIMDAPKHPAPATRSDGHPQLRLICMRALHIHPTVVSAARSL